MPTFREVLFVVVTTLSTGCATIVSKSNWPFSVQTDPPGVEVSITNRKGIEVFRGKTPAAMRLKSGGGFFTKESYTVSLSGKGYETRKINVECKLNAWYFGNILIGGIVGLLIVDPATGAMFKLDSTGVYENMTSLPADRATLTILDKNKLPEHWKDHLISLNQ